AKKRSGSVVAGTPHSRLTRSADAGLATSTAASSAPTAASASRCTPAQRPPPTSPNLTRPAPRAPRGGSGPRAPARGSPEHLGLERRDALELLVEPHLAPLRHRAQHRQRDAQRVDAVVDGGHLARRALGELAVELRDLRAPGEIGRASCREKVERRAGVAGGKSKRSSPTRGASTM